jgi:hypothetical protein
MELKIDKLTNTQLALYLGVVKSVEGGTKAVVTYANEYLNWLKNNE